jgi:Ca2+-transporting ATPase
MTVTHVVLPSGDVSVSTSTDPAGRLFVKDGVPLDPSQDDRLRQLLEVCVLCNNASIAPNGDRPDEMKVVGDPMEAALLILGTKAGLERQELLKAFPEVQEEAFDPELKMMATVHRRDTGYFVAAKGAPEAILDRVSQIASAEGSSPFCEADRTAWRDLTRPHG